METPGDLFTRAPRTTWVCTTCGEKMAMEEGILFGYRGRTLAFRCEECLDRFLLSPETYLSAAAGSCCPSPQECSPASEWSA